jgi:hypothetical protein
MASAATLAPVPTRGVMPRAAPYAVALLLIAWIFLSSPNFRARSGPNAPPFAGDFLQEWVGGHLVLHGDYERFYEPAYAREVEHHAPLIGFQWRETAYFPMVYPPFYYLLLTPLSLLPLPLAAMAWAAALVGSYVLAWVLYVWVRQPDTLSIDKLAWLFPLSLLFMPLIESLTSCQKGAVLLLVLTSTYTLLCRGQCYWAGFVMGLIAFKPQLAIPIAVAMLCKQQWRFVLGGLTSGALLAALCLPLGLDVCRQYVEFSRHATQYLDNAGYDLTKSHAWYGFFALLNGGRVTTTVQAITGIANLGTVAITALALRGRLLPGTSRFAYQFSTLVVATLLLSPHLYTYDLTVLLLPLGLLARAVLMEQVKLSFELKWSALGLFCLAGLSPTVAAATGFQGTVPLLLLFLWANKKAADESVGGLLSGTLASGA